MSTRAGTLWRRFNLWRLRRHDPTFLLLWGVSRLSGIFMSGNLIQREEGDTITIGIEHHFSVSTNNAEVEMQCHFPSWWRDQLFAETTVIIRISKASDALTGSVSILDELCVPSEHHLTEESIAIAMDLVCTFLTIARNAHAAPP